ncbi:pseudouridine synthase [Camelliibacillus cellulosilyticus]|uniref:Pseudouridine synthase n=1 Tax=Camelliibacillus cellulosilyticus TaxID=2174486 RepID=A0ABV9GKX6_9BACL
MDRLQKVIAQAGVASRRKAEQLILDGAVKVNGNKVTELGTKVSPKDRVEVNGVPLEREAPVYYLFYKPSGVISSVKDDRGRKVVTDFFTDINERIFPVGRLDYDTSGLLLLTNDGEFANRLMHPKFKVEKEYIAKINGVPDKETIRRLQKGVKLEDGPTARAKVKLLSADRKKGTALVSITIHEGRNRQVRRMFEAVGFKVLKLKRERYAFLDIRALQPGEFRELKPHEVKRLREGAVT